MCVSGVGCGEDECLWKRGSETFNLTSLRMTLRGVRETRKQPAAPPQALRAVLRFQLPHRAGAAGGACGSLASVDQEGSARPRLDQPVFCRQ